MVPPVYISESAGRGLVESPGRVLRKNEIVEQILAVFPHLDGTNNLAIMDKETVYHEKDLGNPYNGLNSYSGVSTDGCSYFPDGSYCVANGLEKNVFKFNSDHSLAWEVPVSSSVGAFTIAAMPDGGVFHNGGHATTGSDSGVKLDQDGGPEWSIPFFAFECDSDSSGNLFLMGQSEARKINSSGDLVWSYTDNISLNNYHNNGCEFGHDGFLYLTYRPSSGGGNNVVKLDSSGGVVWKKTIDGYGNAIGIDISANSNGDVFVIIDTTLIKLNSSGDEMWRIGPSEDDPSSERIWIAVKASYDGGVYFSDWNNGLSYVNGDGLDRQVIYPNTRVLDISVLPAQAVV